MTQLKKLIIKALKDSSKPKLGKISIFRIINAQSPDIEKTAIYAAIDELVQRKLIIKEVHSYKSIDNDELDAYFDAITQIMEPLRPYEVMSMQALKKQLATKVQFNGKLFNKVTEHCLANGTLFRVRNSYYRERIPPAICEQITMITFILTYGDLSKRDICDNLSRRYSHNQSIDEALIIGIDNGAFKKNSQMYRSR